MYRKYCEWNSHNTSERIRFFFQKKNYTQHKNILRSRITLVLECTVRCCFFHAYVFWFYATTSTWWFYQWSGNVCIFLFDRFTVTLHVHLSFTFIVYPCTFSFLSHLKHFKLYMISSISFLRAIRRRTLLPRWIYRSILLRNE